MGKWAAILFAVRAFWSTRPLPARSTADRATAEIVAAPAA
jgi:hypothetical protein